MIVMNMGSILFCDPNNGQVERTINGNYSSIATSSMYIAAATFQDSLDLRIIRVRRSRPHVGQQSVFMSKSSFSARMGAISPQAAMKNNLAVWDVQTGRELFKGKATILSVDKMVFSPNNQTLVLGDSAQLIFYEVLDGGFRYVNTKKITSDIFSVESLSFSPDGKELAIGNFFGEPLVWNMDDARVRYKLQTEDSVRPVAFSPDGTLVAGAGLQENVYEWTLPDRASPRPSQPRPTDLTDLSIIIVSWNVRDLLAACLESIAAAPGTLGAASSAPTDPAPSALRHGEEPGGEAHVEVIVVDSASADGSADLIRECFPWVHLIACDDNVGFTRGNNIALESAQGRHLMLLNPDTVVHGDALNRLVHYLDAHPEVGIVGPRVLNDDGIDAKHPAAFPDSAHRDFREHMVAGFCAAPRARSLLRHRSAGRRHV